MNNRMKLIFKIIGIYCLLLVANGAFAGDNDTKVTKTITRGALMPKNGYVELFNKYGQVVVGNSDDDSVRVTINIIAYGKDLYTANKIMDRVDFDFNQTNQFLTIETVLDRKSGTFQEVWNNIGDLSKSLLSKNKLEINYEIKVPKHVSLNITNKFGDIYIGERNTKTEIDLSHGNLRSNSFNASSKIAVSYGDARIKYFKSGDLNFKSTDADIKQLGDVELNSSSSSISIGKADELDIDSRSDRSIEIEEVNRITGKMSFSKLEVKEAINSVDLQMSYSDVEIEHMPFSFSLVRISGKTSDISLSFDPNSFIEVDIKANEKDLHLPLASLKKEYIDEKKRLVQLTGTLGTKKNYKGNVYIDVNEGALTLILESSPQSARPN